jgi:two-component system, NarL family, invasion response regulator UvrY
MIRVFIADDHPVVRKGIRQIVSDIPDIVIAGEATNGREALELIGNVVPCDLVLLDLSLPDVDGLDVIKRLKRTHPGLRVLVLTMHSEDQFAIRALKAGAAGYLTKDGAPSELIGAIRKVMAGGRHVNAQLAERLVAHLGPDAERPIHDRLSDREYQVLRMIAAGKNTRQISAELSLSVKTVSTYRSRLLEKMNMRTAAELAAYAVRHHLAD